MRSKQFRQRPLSEATPWDLKARAQAQFKARAELAADKPLATREYRAAEQAQRDLTAKLRTERLAREAKGK